MVTKKYKYCLIKCIYSHIFKENSECICKICKLVYATSSALSEVPVGCKK